MRVAIKIYFHGHHYILAAIKISFYRGHHYILVAIKKSFYRVTTTYL